MNRKSFLRKLGIGLGVAVVTPQILSAENSIPKEEVSFAVDVSAISNIYMGGNKMKPIEIISLWRQTGIFIYDSNNGNAPIVFNGKVEVVDIKNNSKP